MESRSSDKYNYSNDMNGDLLTLNNGTMVEKGTLKFYNPHLNDLDVDVLYHFGMDTKTHDFKMLFGDIKFVCCGGSAGRMKKFANQLLKFLINIEPSCYLDQKGDPKNFCENSDRYVIYKIGPVLCANHGIGIPSCAIMLHEMFKLLHYAGCSNVTFIRLGTCGGIGVDPGTVVVSNGALNGGLEPYFEAFACGKRVKHTIHFDPNLVEKLFEVAHKCDIPVTVGQTLSCDDFYEAQGRLDGAFCSFDEKEKMSFLQKVYSLGVRNIEMEATAFSAMTLRAGHQCAVICVALVNRLLCDQVKTPVKTLKDWEERPCRITAMFIRESLVSSRSNM